MNIWWIIIPCILIAAGIFIYLKKRHDKIITLSNLTSQIQSLSQQCDGLSKTADYYKTQIAKAQQEYESKIDELSNHYYIEKNNTDFALLAMAKKTEEEMNVLNKLYDKLFAELDEQVKVENLNIQQLKATQDAYLQERKRKEQMEQEKDYYRLILSSIDQSDIKELREVQLHINRKDIVDKIIWSGYYKTAFDTLSSHLFKGTEKVCGIYKITCLENDKIYIGQSLDIRTRWSDHIKAGLAFAPASNKLYQEMQKYQPCNFTFEILERCNSIKLNEREKYWIDFYNTKEYGLNGTKGNK